MTHILSPHSSASLRPQAQYAARNPVRPPSVPLESLHWQPPPDLVQRCRGQKTRNLKRLQLQASNRMNSPVTFLGPEASQTPTGISTIETIHSTTAYSSLRFRKPGRQALESESGCRLSQIRTPSDVSVAVFGTHATLPRACKICEVRRGCCIIHRFV